MFEGRDEHLDAVEHACLQILHMAKPLRTKPRHPALDWKLSEVSKRAIEEIERNRKFARHRLGDIIVG